MLKIYIPDIDARGKIFTESIGAVDSLYPSVDIYIKDILEHFKFLINFFSNRYHH